MRAVSRPQAPEPDLLGEPLRRSRDPPVAHRDAWEELVAAVGGEDEQRQVGQAAGQRLEDLERQVVRPVEVFEGHDDRAVGRRVSRAGPAMSRTSSRRRRDRRRRRARSPSSSRLPESPAEVPARSRPAACARPRSMRIAAATWRSLG